MRRHGSRFPSALRPTHFARPGKEHEAESPAGPGRELKPAAVHEAHPPARLHHHRGEARFPKPGFRRPERRRLVARPRHHETVRVEAESGEPRRMKRGERTALDHAPQDRPAEANAKHRREGGGPGTGHRMHPSSIQTAAEPAVDLPSVHARPGRSPPPFERSDPGPQLLPRTLHAETAMGPSFSLVLFWFSLWRFFGPDVNRARSRPRDLFTLTDLRPGLDAHRSSWERRVFGDVGGTRGPRASRLQMGRKTATGRCGRDTRSGGRAVRRTPAPGRALPGADTGMDARRRPLL